ncbi:MAG: hypothetical protein ACREEM_24635 [Blastocatellia bacterium]
MQNMLAYTIQGSNYSGSVPYIVIGQGATKQWVNPQAPQDDSYWIAILDRTTPGKVVKDFVIPGSNNSSVPAGLDTYMSNPAYIFALVTQHLSTLHVPQGDFYDYLAKYGAGRALQRLEQLNTSLGCGSISGMSYLLTGQCGPRGNGIPSPPSYELGSYQNPVLLTMSLMPLSNGQPPYSICDHNTFLTR